MSIAELFSLNANAKKYWVAKKFPLFYQVNGVDYCGNEK